MLENLVYKKCDLDDVQLLTAISRETFIAAFETDNNPDDFKTYIDSAFNERQIKSELLDVNSEFYFVYRDTDLVGYFKINENEAQAEPFGSNALELSRIYVLRPFQGQQLGHQILLEIIDIAIRKQKTNLWLGVWERNIRAIHFYERHRFKKFDTHSFYIGNDKQTDWIMHLDLV